MGRINISNYLKPKFYYQNNVYYSVDEVIKALKKDCLATITPQSFSRKFTYSTQERKVPLHSIHTNTNQ